MTGAFEQVTGLARDWRDNDRVLLKSLNEKILTLYVPDKDVINDLKEIPRIKSELHGLKDQLDCQRVPRRCPCHSCIFAIFEICRGHFYIYMRCYPDHKSTKGQG